MRKIQHHTSHNTWRDRYPDIFRRCADYFNDRPIRVLSFGCSTGAEVSTLRDLYFTGSHIHGVDIDSEMIKGCLALGDKSTSFSDEPTGMYDLIFCMSVLCKGENAWQDGYFADFEEQLAILNDHLNVGGLLVLYNAKFRLSDSAIYQHYEPLCEFEESGFIKKYDPVGNVVDTYKHVIFKKKSSN